MTGFLHVDVSLSLLIRNIRIAVRYFNLIKTIAIHCIKRKQTRLDMETVCQQISPDLV